MLSKWSEITLSDIGSKTSRAFAMGPFGSNITSDNYRDSGIPVIRGINLGDVGDAPFNTRGLTYVDDAKAKQLSSSQAFANDIVFVAQGTVGKVGLIPIDSQYRCFLLSQNLMKVSVDPDLADPAYVFYYFRSPFGQHQIRSRVNSTGVPCISQPLTSLRSFKIVLPPLSEQRAIASILGALDDKIELNRKMSGTLEAMARALFKSWFVDFNPVRAKMGGRETGLSDEIIALFADSFIADGLPDGWTIGNINDLCDSISSGGTPARMNGQYWNSGTIPWYKTGEMKDEFLVGPSEYITELGLTNSSCKLWPTGTILFALYASPTVGRLGVLTTPGTSNQAAAGLSPNGSTGFAYLFQTLFAARQDIQHIAVGAAQQNINLGVLRNHKVVLPPSALRLKYSALMQPLFDRRQNLQFESLTLTNLRDALLPKLISGKLRVAEAERILEKSA